MNLRLILLPQFFLLGLCYDSTGQINSEKIILEGRTMDSQTKEEIPFVNIYYLESNEGTSSDLRGNFSIQIKKHSVSDTLVFSAIGYKTSKISISEILKHSYQMFYLEENILTLEEVTVGATSAVEIIKQAMNARKKNYGILPHKLSGMYRVADKENGAYVRLLEAAVDIYDPNYMKKNSRLVDYLALRQSKDFRTFKWKVDKLNARNVEELLKPDFIKRPTRATHPNGFERGFLYAFEKYALLDNDEVYIISATKNPAYEWANYNAIFYVRAKDLAILRVDRDYNIVRPNWARAHNVKTNITKDQLILKYKETNGKLFLNYFLWNLRGDVLEEKSEKKIISFERNAEINIQSVTFEKKDKIRTAWDEDIYKMTEPYNADFWENYPVSNTQLFKQVIKELEERGDLNEQFFSSDDKYSIYDPKRFYKIKELKEDFLLFRKSLEEGHPSLYRYTTRSDFSGFFDSTFQQLSKPLNEVDFYKLLTPLIAKINCGHTEGLLSEDYCKFYDHRERYFPLRTKLTNRKLFVLQNYIMTDTIISYGDQILSIDGKPIAKIIKTIYPNLPSDGYIQTSKDQIFGQNFSHLYSIYYENKDIFSIKIKKPNGQILEKKLPGISYSHFLSPKEKNDNDNAYDIFKPGVALLKVSNFMDSKDQSFKKWVKNSFESISKNKIDDLIIDLRDNNGGRDDYALYLYSFLTPDPFYYHRSLESATDNYSFISFTNQDSSFNKLISKIVQKDSIGRYMLNSSHPTLGIHESSSPVFEGRVFFLINGNTFSAAADFAAIAKQNNRGVFIGEETGGTAKGNTSNGELILTLPNTGIRVRIPLFKIVNAVNTQVDGRGVVPDHNIIYEGIDIIERRDKALEFGLNVIEKNANDR